MRSPKAIPAAGLVVLLMGGSYSVAADNPDWAPRELPDGIAIDDPRIGTDTASDFYKPEDCSGEVCAEQVAVYFMPFGCEGNSDNPHRSTTEAEQGSNEITEKSKTKCPNQIKRVTVANQLWRNHFLFWGKEGTTGYESKRDKRHVEAVAVTACNNDLYLVTASHTLVGYNDKTYFGASGKSASIAC